MLNVGFIYPISYSRWVSPLVVVPKKNGKWWICVDYRALNKATKNDHFPLPFIDKVLDTLARKHFFSFLDGFRGYNQICIAPEDQDKTTFTCPWGTFSYNVLPFRLHNAPATFQRAVLSIFVDIVNDCVEVYMDDFTVCGNTYEEAKTNLEKLRKRYIDTNLSLSHEKCYILMTKGIILRHYISSQGIQVDPKEIQIIQNLPTPSSQKDVHIFLDHSMYYRRFIQNFSNLASPLFYLLAKYVTLLWTSECQEAFKTIKTKLVTTHVLRGPNWVLPFIIHTDASDFSMGAVLGQKKIISSILSTTSARTS